MGYFAAPGQNGHIRGVRVGDETPVVTTKKVRKIETTLHIPDQVILAAAQVESMSPTLIKKVITSRRHHRYDSDRGKAHREHEKFKLGRYV